MKQTLYGSIVKISNDMSSLGRPTEQQENILASLFAFALVSGSMGADEIEKRGDDGKYLWLPTEFYTHKGAFLRKIRNSLVALHGPDCSAGKMLDQKIDEWNASAAPGQQVEGRYKPAPRSTFCV